MQHVQLVDVNSGLLIPRVSAGPRTDSNGYLLGHTYPFHPSAWLVLRVVKGCEKKIAAGEMQYEVFESGLLWRECERDGDYILTMKTHERGAGIVISPERGFVNETRPRNDKYRVARRL